MTVSTCFCCDVPGCQSNITIHTVDAKDNPELALIRAGWQVTGRDADGTKVVARCLCPTHRTHNAESVPEDD